MPYNLGSAAHEERRDRFEAMMVRLLLINTQALIEIVKENNGSVGATLQAEFDAHKADFLGELPEDME